MIMKDVTVNLVPAHARRLSGPDERSNGDGQSWATIVHVMATDDVRIGRIRRSKYQFLCRIWHPWDISEHKAGTPITCPKCAEILKRSRLEMPPA